MRRKLRRTETAPVVTDLRQSPLAEGDGSVVARLVARPPSPRRVCGFDLPDGADQLARSPGPERREDFAPRRHGVLSDETRRAIGQDRRGAYVLGGGAAHKRVMVRRSRRRPRYAHGCGDTCGRKAGYCPQRLRTNPETADTKSRAGRRAVGLPARLVDLFRVHQAKQTAERAAAGDDWTDEGWLFATPTVRGTSPRTDYDDWKELLTDAKARDGRLRDARHTAATVPLILGVSERAVMRLMGWSTTAMAARYQHMVDSVRSDVARQVDGLIWKPGENGQDDEGDGFAGH